MKTSVEIVIARHLPLENGGYRHERLTGGISSEAYKVEPSDALSSEMKLVLTIIRDPSLWWKIRQEYALRDLIQGNAEIPLPKLYDAGFDDIDDERIAFIFREFIQGTELDAVLSSSLGAQTQEQDISNLSHDLGYRLGVMHHQSGALFGQLGKTRELLYPSWSSFILEAIETEIHLTSQLDGNLQLGKIRALDLQILLPKIQRLIGALQSSLLQVSLPQLTHGDAHFKNIIAGRDSGNQTWKVKSFIDTEEALGGDPEIDIAYIENWLHFSDYKNEFFKSRGEFESGYTNERKISARYGDRRLIYHCLRSLSFLRTVFEFDADVFLSANPRNAEYVAKHLDILDSLANGNALEDIGIQSLV